MLSIQAVRGLPPFRCMVACSCVKSIALQCRDRSAASYIHRLTALRGSSRSRRCCCCCGDVTPSRSLSMMHPTEWILPRRRRSLALEMGQSAEKNADIRPKLVSIKTASTRRLKSRLRYDTTRDVILTCARKPTRVSLIYRTGTTTKKRKTEKLKRKTSML